MEPVKIPCPYAPDCLWVSIPLDFDKALILVEQHVKFKHPEAAEQTSTVRIRIKNILKRLFLIIPFNMKGSRKNCHQLKYERCHKFCVKWSWMHAAEQFTRGQRDRYP